MSKILKIEVAVLVVLLVVAVFVRFDTMTPQDDPSLNSSVNPTDAPTEPPTDPPTDPPTEPPTEPVTITFGEDFAVEADTFFVYNVTDDVWMGASGDIDRHIYPASITKLFTAYVAMSVLEPERVITLGSEVNMVASDSSLAYLKPGMKLTTEQLLACMLLPSGNDAAYAIAVAAAREYYDAADMSAYTALKSFVTLMNEQAVEEGLTGSNFVNPDGYHDANHYTSPHDLAIIARLALSNELIARTVSTSTMRVTYVSGESKTLHNTNLLIDPQSSFYCENAIGLKTGNTSAAGPCLLSAFEVEGKQIVIGTMACGWLDARFTDTLKLYHLVVEAFATAE